MTKYFNRLMPTRLDHILSSFRRVLQQLDDLIDGNDKQMTSIQGHIDNLFEEMDDLRIESLKAQRVRDNIAKLIED